MGLLDRFRPARGDEPQLGADDLDRGGIADTPGAPPADVIRPETLWPAAPEWTKVPPMAPSLPAMPLVVSTHFEDSLTARQPPERFLGDLGHSVSESAPSGMVEAVAILVPPAPAPDPARGSVPAPGEPAERAAPSTPAASEQPLTLAMPAPPAERADSGRWETARRLPGFPGLRGQPAEETGTEWSETATPEASEPTAPTPPAEPVTPVGEPPRAEPVADLVGAAPITAAPDPIVSIQGPAPVSRLVTAPTPPEMPLAQLPATRLPPEAQTRRLMGPMEGEPAPLLGEGRGIEPTISAAPPMVPESTAVPAAAPAPVDMPLASPSSPETRAETPPVPSAGSASGSAADPSAQTGAPDPDPNQARDTQTAPTVGAAEPISVLPSPSEPESPIEAASPAGPPDLPLDLPLATNPPAPASDAADDPTAPILGQRPVLEPNAAPLVAPPEPAPAPPSPATDRPLAPGAPTAPRRSGLGEPMMSLPPTAAPLSIANMNRAQQIELSRSLIQSQLASRSRSNLAIGQQLHQGAPPAATRSPAADSGLPLARPPQPEVPIEPLENPSSGVVYDDLPPATGETAPLLSMDPLVGRQEAAAGPSSSPEAPEGARIRTAIGQRHGVDLTNVPVDRSERGAAEAHRLGARAYTSDLAVVIPPQAGTLDSGPGQALFAHELTHVAQRMRTSGNIPSESSPAGQMMEAEAVQTELTLNRGGSVQPLADAPIGSSARPSGSAGTGFSAGAAAALPLAASAATAPNPDYDALANSIISRMTTLTAPGYPTTEVFSATTSMAGAVSEPAPAAASIQRASLDLPTVSPDTPTPVPQPTGVTPFTERPSDDVLSNLTRWLYPLIKFRLKNDLREDRERAGLLTDNYRRW